MKFGIDLGTTFSSVAVCEDDGGKLSVQEVAMSGADGKDALPSAVFIESPEKFVVGQAAINQLAAKPDRVVQWIKRSMGEDFKVRIDEVDYTPQQISAEILKVLKADAESWAGESMEAAVVCVPAWFGDRQRDATRQAVEAAGIPLLKLLSEPSAAAMAVSIERPGEVADRDVLVYDLGGGTFDVVLIRTKSGEGGRLNVETLCSAGDRKLGGHDWDLALAKYLSQRCVDQFSHDPSLDLRERAVMLDAVERGKRLFNDKTTSVNITCGLHGHAIDLTIAEYLDVTAHLRERTGQWVQSVLDEGCGKHGVDKDKLAVILCGGGSKAAGVADMVTHLVGHAPLALKRMNPELLVVRGAAYAAMLGDREAEAAAGGGAAPPPVATVDRYRAVGVEAVVPSSNGEPKYVNQVVLPEGAVADQRGVRRFAIGEDNQTELYIPVYQGAASDIAACEVIGEIVVTGLPADRKAGAKVTVTMWYDASGILHGSAEDESGTKADITIQR